MQLRNPKRAIPVDRINDPLVLSDDADLLQDEKILRELEEAMQHLNAEQKTCVYKFYLQKKSYQAIAAETGFSLSQIKSYIQNGKRNLRLLLEKKIDNLER
jgi:RNA polymerase sigma-70 factor (ECF subfamily)